VDIQSQQDLRDDPEIDLAFARLPAYPGGNGR